MATTERGRVLVLEGHAAERGRQHGEALRDEVRASLCRFLDDAAIRTGLPGARYVEQFLADTDFVGAIRAHTPALLEELSGIAEGAGVPPEQVLAYNFLDEEWWYSETRRSKCSALAVPARDGQPALVAQTMDLPLPMDGGQVLLRHRDPDGREVAVLSAAGLIGLTGASSDGVGICVNALGMLRHDAHGLPVACVLRGALERPTARAAAEFIRSVPHASGQHYAVVDAGGDAIGLECGAGGATVSADGTARFFHTNHPLASADVDPDVTRELEQVESSRRRQAALETGGPRVSSRADARALLGDRTAPICVSRADRSAWVTFGAVVTEVGETVTMEVALGPPDETPWLEVELLAVTAAERLAAFAVALRHDDVPSAVRTRAVVHVLDAVGCAYAASALDEGTEPRSVAIAQGGTAAAAVIGTRVRLPAPGAALANGTLMHALDYDDTHPPSICHITTVVAPAALAVAGATGASGADLVTAYVAGCETVARIGAAADGEFHRRGFHATGVCGVFGATVAATRLLRLDAAATTCALGIAGSFAPGLLEFLGDGSSTKRLHAGGAARAGVEAALLAAAGATGPAGVLDGRYGVFATHLGDPHAAALEAQLADLGERWETSALAIKPFPCCHFMHGALEALQSLGLGADDVTAIDVRVADAGVGLILEPAAAKPRPRTPYDAKFSLPFTAGALLVHGRVGVTTFTAQGIDDEAAVAVARRMTYEPVPLAEMANGFGGAVAVRTPDGRTLTASVDHPRGSVAAPMTEADVRAKFRDNAGLALAAADVERLEAAILGADEAELAPQPVP